MSQRTYRIFLGDILEAIAKIDLSLANCICGKIAHT